MTTAPGAHVPLGEGPEFDAIRTMLGEWGPRARGIGDDAAVLDVPERQQLVVSTDASVEGVHFRREWLSAEEIGARAAAAALSDLAAMAASPLGLLLALAVPVSWRSEIPELARGLGATAARAGCPIVGGNVTRASELSLTITVLGSAASPLRRSGVRAGDAIFVTGTLGGPGAALRALLSGRVPSSADMMRFIAPVPRLAEARWLAAHGAHAAIDLSDGVLGDAAHLARASGVTLALDLAVVPRVAGVTPDEAASSGEEYELLVAMPPDAPIDTGAFAREFALPLTAIGVASTYDGEPVRVDRRPPPLSGHDHFR
jgi:thiamine-monophosphate kinase